MRTTVTLEPDADAIVRRLMRERGLSFKEALNLAVRTGAGSSGGREPFVTPTFDLGRALVPVAKALELSGRLEDEELSRKRALGK